MANASLAATPRTGTGKGAARALRRDGQVPAVIYGHAREPQPLAVNTRELDRLLGRISAANTVVELALDGRTSRTLIREIQRHPVKRHVMHVDFQELVAGEKVTVTVPIVLVGTPEGVRTDGGVMDQVLRELQIEVDPANIPNHIDVDVTAVTIGHTLHVSDLVIPPGVTVLDDEDATVMTVAAPKVAEDTPETTEADASAEPEVIRSKKADEEGE